VETCILRKQHYISGQGRHVTLDGLRAYANFWKADKHSIGDQMVVSLTLYKSNSQTEQFYEFSVQFVQYRTEIKYS